MLISTIDSRQDTITTDSDTTTQGITLLAGIDTIQALETEAFVADTFEIDTSATGIFKEGTEFQNTGDTD